MLSVMSPSMHPKDRYDVCADCRATSRACSTLDHHSPPNPRPPKAAAAEPPQSSATKASARAAKTAAAETATAQ